MASDTALFLHRLISNPRQIAAIAPSSVFLARAMAWTLGPGTGRVVEFGPGTGSLTRAILARGVAPSDLTLFELDALFVDKLHHTFAGVTIHHAPANDAARHVAPGVGAVVSGLPLLSMPKSVVAAIIGAAFAILKPGAPLIQYTYGPKPPIPDSIVQDLNLTAERGPHVWWNLPPAQVYHFTQSAG